MHFNFFVFNKIVFCFVLLTIHDDMGYKLNEKYFFLLWWRQWVWQRTEREREIRFLHFFAEMLKYRFCSCFQYFFSYFVMLILFFFKIFFFNIVYLDFFNFFSLNFTRKINICAFKKNFFFFITSQVFFAEKNLTLNSYCATSQILKILKNLLLGVKKFSHLIEWQPQNTIVQHDMI